MTVELSTVKPDFGDLVAQLQTALSNKDAWKDLLATATGQTIIEFIAAIGAFSQYNIESTFQEPFLDTAKLDSSIYAITRMLGVRMTRKLPAHVTVSLTRDSSVGYMEISPFSQFSANSVLLFNRLAISFAPGQTQQTVTLYQGSIKTFTGTGTGLPFQSFLTPENSFQVSDLDVKVTVDSIPIPVVPEGIWHHGNNDAAVQDTTNPDGQMDLFFGNNAFGTMPANGAEVVIAYAVTLGSSGNDLNFLGTILQLNTDTTVRGIATTSLLDGANEHDAETYRKISPLLFAAGERAVTQNDYEAIALNYPGVLDARVQGQRDLAPQNVKWMNLIRVSLITQSVWDNTAWLDFITWYRKRAMYSGVFYRHDPTIKAIDVNAEIYCFNTVELTAVQNAASLSLQDFFTPRRGFIGLNVFKSDIIDTIRHSHTGIDYIRLNLPVIDNFMRITGPATVICTAAPGGTLVADTYVYYISSLTEQGETLATSSSAISTTATGLVTIAWSNIPGATGYKVYGRRKTGVPGLLATVPQTGLSTYVFQDIGVLTPGASIPSSDTSGLYYPSLGNVTLNTQYSDRNLVERVDAHSQI